MAGSTTIDIENLDQVYSSIFRSNEIRGVRAILRRKNLVTGAISERMVGVVSEAAFASNGAFQIVVRETSEEVFEAAYPKKVINSELLGTVDVGNFDINLPITVVLGATREHIPCRYIQADYERNRFRYAVCTDLSTSSTASPLPRYRDWETDRKSTRLNSSH